MPIKNLQTRAAVLGHVKIGGRKKISTRNGERIIPCKYDHFKVTTNEQGELGYIEDDVLKRKLMDEQLAIIRNEHTEKIWGERPIFDITGISGREPDGKYREKKSSIEISIDPPKKRVVRDEDGTILFERYLEKTIQHISDKRLDEMNDRLRRILVALPFDDIDQNLVTSLSVYDREGCRCRGDGESAEWVNPRSGEVEKVHCPCNMLMVYLNDQDDPDDRPQHGKKERGMIPNEKNGFFCKANGVLRLKIAAARTLGGVHLFRTTSINSIRQLMSAMQEVSGITGGVLAGIPLVFEVDAKTVRPFPNKPPQKAYVVNLTYKASALEFLETAIEQAKLRDHLKKQLATAEIAQLPAPGFENLHDQVAIAQEFYAETPREYIDAEVEDTPEMDTAPHQDNVPPTLSDDDAPDAEVKDKPKKADRPKGSTEREDTSKEAQKPKDEPKEKPKSEKNSAPQEPSDATETTEEPMEAREGSPSQEAAEPPQKAKASPLHNSDPQQQLDEGNTEESLAAASTETVDSEAAGDYKATNRQNGDGAVSGDTARSKSSNGFPDIIRDKPDGADTKPAPKALRKEFFITARKKGFTDADIRNWIDKLWETKTSASLLIWQVESMLAAIR